MSFLSSLFFSPAKRRLMAAVGWCDDAFAEHSAWPDVKRLLVQQIRRQADRAIQIGPADKDAANAVLFAAFRICSAHCTSGEYHIYRGVLSGTGKGYQNLAWEIMNNLTENGFISEDDATEEMDGLRTAIKEGG